MKTLCAVSMLCVAAAAGLAAQSVTKYRGSTAPPLRGTFRTWSGDARAHWEGDTLVVETRNFNNRTTSFAGAGFSGENLANALSAVRKAERDAAGGK